MLYAQELDVDNVDRVNDLQAVQYLQHQLYTTQEEKNVQFEDNDDNNNSNVQCKRGNSRRHA